MITRRLTKEELIELGEITFDWFEDYDQVSGGLYALNAFVLGVSADKSPRNMLSDGPGDIGVQLLSNLNHFVLLYVSFMDRVERERRS